MTLAFGVMALRSSPARRAIGVALATLVLSACQPNRFVSGWVPYWQSSDGTAAINSDAASAMGEMSPFWYSATGSSATITRTGSASALATVMSALRAQGLPVVPSITDGTSAGVMSALIANPSARATHVNAIVSLVVNNGYDGIDIDYEVFAYSQIPQWSSIQPNWIAFVRELADALHSRGKLLSVTVPPVWIDQWGNNRGYWVYAQQEIAASVDRLRLMVYDWSVSTPGPIAPMSWVNQVIAWSDSRVPNEKLQLGVPAYGRHWAAATDQSQVCPSGSTYRVALEMGEVQPLAAAQSLTPTRDASGELTFSWIQTVNAQCQVRHTVYAPDGTSVRQRAEAALAAGWSGIALWAIGYETADMWEQLMGLDAGRPNGDPVLALDQPLIIGPHTPEGWTAPTIVAPSIDQPATGPYIAAQRVSPPLPPGTARVTISGLAYDPEFDLPVPVRVTVDGANPVVVLARSARPDTPATLGAYHGFSEVRTVSTGVHQFCVTHLRWGGGDGVTQCTSVTIN